MSFCSLYIYMNFKNIESMDSYENINYKVYKLGFKKVLNFDSISLNIKAFPEYYINKIKKSSHNTILS